MNLLIFCMSGAWPQVLLCSQPGDDPGSVSAGVAQPPGLPFPLYLPPHFPYICLYPIPALQVGTVGALQDAAWLQLLHKQLSGQG